MGPTAKPRQKMAQAKPEMGPITLTPELLTLAKTPQAVFMPLFLGQYQLPARVNFVTILQHPRRPRLPHPRGSSSVRVAGEMTDLSNVDKLPHPRACVWLDLTCLIQAS
jgi:hypothetical protein